MAVQYANHKELRRKVYKVLSSNPRGIHLDELIGSIGVSSKEDMNYVGDMLQCMKKHNYFRYDQSNKYLQPNNYKKSFKKPQNSPYNINKSNN